MLELIKMFNKKVGLYRMINNNGNVHYCLADEYRTDWVVFYNRSSNDVFGNSYSFAHDGYFKLSKSMRDYLYNLGINDKDVIDDVCNKLIKENKKEL